MSEREFNAIFSERLRYYLNKYEITQLELSKRLGVGTTSVYNWCNGIKSPRMDKVDAMCKIFHCKRSDLMEDKVHTGKPPSSNMVTDEEYEHIKKYRTLDPYGQETVNLILNRESDRVEQLKKAATATLVEFPAPDAEKRLVKYFHSVSAGTGVFILGNEATDQIAIPDIPEYKAVDIAVDVSGHSMEPDYMDGDIVLVSSKKEMRYGDVGIFIVNNEAFIKEYGEKELISRNPDYDNIKISEYDTIVCMGKVIDKLTVSIQQD